MAPLAIDFIAAAALAPFVGSTRPKSLKAAIALCGLIAMAGLGASYPIVAGSTRFGGDAFNAEDYFNDFSVRVAAAEITVALVWTFLWFGLGRVTLLTIRHVRKSAA